jgi:hypothetical protein
MINTEVDSLASVLRSGLENGAMLRWYGLVEYFGEMGVNSRLYSDKACYHSVQRLSSFRLLSKSIKIKIHRREISYGSDSWSLTFREVHRLKVFENRVLKTFEPKREGILRGWRKVRNEEILNLYSSPNILRMIKSRRMRWTEHVEHMGQKSSAYRILLGKAEGKRQIGRPRRRWENNIKMHYREVGWGVMDWIGLAQDRSSGKLL